MHQLHQKPQQHQSKGANNKNINTAEQKKRAGRYKTKVVLWFYKVKSAILEDVSVPLMAMYFLMLMVNTILRDTKDTLLVMSPAGVEAIPVLKTWAVIPGSMCYFYAYSKLAKSTSKQRCFQTVLYSFTFFYVFYSLVLFPLKDALTPRVTAQYLRSILPKKIHLITRLMEEWMAALFYIVSEMWSSGVCQLMFWQVANDVMSVEEAASTYPFIGLFGNLGMFFAGILLQKFADQRDVVSAAAYLRIPRRKKHNKPYHNTTRYSSRRLSEFWSPVNTGVQQHTIHQDDPVARAWRETLFGIAFIVLTFTLLNILLYKAVARRKTTKFNGDIENFLSPPAQNQTNTNQEKISNSKHNSKKNKKKSLSESLKVLSKSKPLRCVAILVVSYGISSCLVEVSWKGQVKRSYVSSNEYARFMATFWTFTGAMSMLFMFAGRVILRKVGYKVAVLFTPVLVFISGTVFFLVSITQDTTTATITRTQQLPYAAYSGAFLVMMAKSAKYAFFDSTKEMIFIPLDKESKSVGKAAIELVAYRLAKSGGSCYLQVVFIVFGSIIEGAGIIPIAIFFFAVVSFWTLAACEAAEVMNRSQQEHTM